MIKIGVVEDDPLLNEALCISLEKEGYEVCSGFSVKDGIGLLDQEPDVLLLDITLPDGQGFSIIEKAKEIPTIFLTAQDNEIDMLHAFERGCEDYIVKPFSMEILKRRIQVVLRRNGGKLNTLVYRDLKIDYLKKQVYKNDRPVKLTAKEYQLLEYLSRNMGQVLSKEMILQKVWDLDGMFVVENTVSVTVNRLRKKIETDSETSGYIKNVFGMGYLFGE